MASKKIFYNDLKKQNDTNQLQRMSRQALDKLREIKMKSTTE